MVCTASSRLCLARSGAMSDRRYGARSSPITSAGFAICLKSWARSLPGDERKAGITHIGPEYRIYRSDAGPYILGYTPFLGDPFRAATQQQDVKGDYHEQGTRPSR